ncbi:MAG: ABC transporter substrate-binding protein [Alphaproteobacteria bacterium]|nr:ABC transporter substrate-binding protein [Alphaproteobacteria bacterium]
MTASTIDRRTALRLGVLGIATLPFVSRLASASDMSAAAPVRSFGDALIATMRAGSQRVPFSQRFAMLAPAIDRAFDLETILRVSVGPQWSTLPAGQQAALATAFRNYTVANFVANFDSYNGQSIQISPEARLQPSGDQVISTRLGTPGGESTVLAYVMRPTSAGWKAVDVLAGGSISRVATQRSDFRSLLASGGGSALVASLQNKVSVLSGGSLA